MIVQTPSSAEGIRLSRGLPANEIMPSLKKCSRLEGEVSTTHPRIVRSRRPSCSLSCCARSLSTSIMIEVRRVPGLDLYGSGSLHPRSSWRAQQAHLAAVSRSGPLNRRTNSRLESHSSRDVTAGSSRPASPNRCLMNLSAQDFSISFSAETKSSAWSRKRSKSGSIALGTCAEGSVVHRCRGPSPSVR